MELLWELPWNAINCRQDLMPNATHPNHSTHSAQASGASVPLAKDDDTQTLNQRLTQLKQLLQERANEAEPDVTRLIAQVESTLQSLGENAQESADALVERLKFAKINADRYARERPWQVAGMAIGLGTLLGFLMGRCKK
jgi:ElaB/YqjD/DUF883 family membrane-anchored ribosome-binding protein